jgi:hypothetical protein
MSQIQEKNALLQRLMKEWPTKLQLEKGKVVDSQSQSDSKRARIDLTVKDAEASQCIKEEEEEDLILASKAVEALQWVRFNTRGNDEVDIL